MKITVDKSKWCQHLCVFSSWDEEIAFAEKQGYSLILPGEFEGEEIFCVVSHPYQMSLVALDNEIPLCPVFTKSKQMKTFYIHVPVPEISAAVQNRLFELGYKWAMGGKKIQHTNCKYIIVFYDGVICYDNDSENCRNCDKFTIEELFSPSFPPFPPPRPDVILPPGEIVPDYAVKIGEKGITVGCQTVSFPAFETLAGAVSDYLSKK